MITLEAKVLEYIPNAFQDQMEDGAFTSYDGSQIVITSPSNYKDLKFTILHDENIADSSFWKSTDAEFKFTIESEFLEDSQLIFKDAIESITLKSNKTP